MASPTAEHNGAAALLDVGQRIALIEFLTNSLVEVIAFDEDELGTIRRLPLSLRLSIIPRLLESLDHQRDIVATLQFATIELGYDQE